MPMPMVLSQRFLNFSIASSVFSANSQSQFNGGSFLGHLRLQFVANPSGSIVKEIVRTPEHRPGFKRARNSLQCTATHDPSGNTQALTPELKDTLDKFITSNKVVLFMKGTKDFPQCGFSNTIVQILNSLNVPFETFNILENESLRQGLKVYSNWPTFPQLYIDGEFFGGCDITIANKLKKKMEGKKIKGNDATDQDKMEKLSIQKRRITGVIGEGNVFLISGITQTCTLYICTNIFVDLCFPL